MGRNSAHFAPVPPWLPDFRKAYKRGIGVDAEGLLAPAPFGSMFQATSVTVQCRTPYSPAALRGIFCVRRDMLRPLWHIGLVGRAPDMIVLPAVSDCAGFSGTESPATVEMDSTALALHDSESDTPLLGALPKSGLVDPPRICLSYTAEDRALRGELRREVFTLPPFGTTPRRPYAA